MQRPRFPSVIALLFAAAVARGSGLPDPAFAPGPIGVRSGLAGPEFFNRTSGDTFVPRGANWMLLSGAGRSERNASFREPEYAQARPRTQAMLRRMRGLGYNVVRIKLEGADFAGPERKRRGLNSAAVANLVDFVRLAAAEGIRVEVAGGWTPGNYYSAVMAEDYPRPQPGAEGSNMVLMSPGLAAAQGYYLSDVLAALRQASPDLLGDVFAVDLWDEFALDADKRPFSESDGKFTLRMVRRTYRLDDADSRQALADDATARWVELAAAPIRSAAPGVLLTLSTFSPHQANRDGYTGVTSSDSSDFDPRQPLRPTVLEKSSLDFLEIHIDPHDIDGSIDAELTPMEWPSLTRTKPVLLGAFSAHRRDYGSVASAESALGFFLGNIRGRQINGWLYWSWDTTDGHGNSPFWNLDDDDGYLAKALAPSAKPW